MLIVIFVVKLIFVIKIKEKFINKSVILKSKMFDLDSGLEELMEINVFYLNIFLFGFIYF